jgi:NADH-quinone oxidoreductase subunit M
LLPEIGGGLGKAMPGLFYLWMAAALANLGLPAMSGFVAESAVFYGAFSSPMAQTMKDAAGVQCAIVFACTGVVLTAGYMLWLLKRLFYGEEQAKWKGHLSDCLPWERSLGYVMTAMIIAMGVYPSFVTNSYNEVVNRLISAVNTRTISAAPTTDSRL